MSQPNSPLTRSIGLAGVVRWLIAVVAVIATGAALAAGQYVMAVGGVVFLGVAVAFAIRAWRARQAAASGAPPPK